MKAHSVLCKAVKPASLRQDSFFHAVTLEKNLYNDRGLVCLLFSSIRIEIMTDVIDHFSPRKSKKKKKFDQTMNF